MNKKIIVLIISILMIFCFAQSLLASNLLKTIPKPKQYGPYIFAKDKLIELADSGNHKTFHNETERIEFARKLYEKTKANLSQLEKCLGIRWNLLPNLIEAIEIQTKHENTLFKIFNKIRAEYLRANALSDKFKASNKLSDIVTYILVLTEHHPELKSNQSFLRLHEHLLNNENRISVSIRKYNMSVEEYNNVIKGIKTNSNLLKNAIPFGISERPKKSAKVKF